MDFAQRLNRVINEALAAPDAMLNAPDAVSDKIETSKANQRVRMVERAADQAVKALEQINRVLKAPDYKGDASFEAMTAAIDNIIVGLGKDGNMRRSMSSLLTLPPHDSN